MLAPSRVLRETPPQTGGGRTREELLDEADAVMERAPQSLRFASRLLDKDNRERASLFTPGPGGATISPKGATALPARARMTASVAATGSRRSRC